MEGDMWAITCKDCTRIYLGQTGRKLGDRVKEHERAIKKGDVNNACAKHNVETKHEIELQDVKVVYKEKMGSIRLALESYTIAANQSRLLNLAPPIVSMLKWSALLSDAVSR